MGVTEFEGLPWWQQHMYVTELSTDLTSTTPDGATEGEQAGWVEIGDEDLSEHFTIR